MSHGNPNAPRPANGAENPTEVGTRPVKRESRTCFAVKTMEGRTVLEVGSDEYGHGILRLFNHEQRVIVEAGALSSGEGYITVHNRDAQEGVRLFAGQHESWICAIDPKDQETRAAIITDHGDGSLELKDKYGDASVVLFG